MEGGNEPRPPRSPLPAGHGDLRRGDDPPVCALRISAQPGVTNLRRHASHPRGDGNVPRQRPHVGTKEVDRGRLRRPIARDRRYEPSIAKRRPHQNAHRPRERCVGDHRDRRDPRRRGGRFRPLTARREHEGSHEDCPENPAPHGTPLVVRYPVNRSSSEMDATLTIHTYYTRY